MDQKTVPLRFERFVHAHQRLGCRALQKRAGLVVEDGGHEVVGARVANVEQDRVVEAGEVHKIRRPEAVSDQRLLLGR